MESAEKFVDSYEIEQKISAVVTKRAARRRLFHSLSKKSVIASQCAPRSKCPWGTPRNDRGEVYRHAETSLETERSYLL